MDGRSIPYWELLRMISLQVLGEVLDYPALGLRIVCQPRLRYTMENANFSTVYIGLA